jgi:hypothetical protein
VRRIDHVAHQHELGAPALLGGQDAGDRLRLLAAPGIRAHGSLRRILAKRDEVALQVRVVEREELVASSVHHPHAQQVAAEHPLLRCVRVGGGLERDHRAKREFGEHANADHPRIVALDQRDMRVQAAQLVAIECAKNLAVLDLLHREDVEVHLPDPPRDLRRLSGLPRFHQPPHEGAGLHVALAERQLYPARLVRGQGSDFSLEVVARKKLLRLNVPTEMSLTGAPG